MSVMEIVLLIAGALLFVGSFFVSEKDKQNDKQIQKLAKEEINRLVEEKMNEVKNHIDDVVDEAITYSMEKTERSMERLSNEKIMAVNEYSDTVLAEIHRNHEEVMFLYDMLNDKHSYLKDEVSKATLAAKEVNDSRIEAEAVVNSMQQLKEDSLEKEERDEKPKTTKKKTKKTEAKKPAEEFNILDLDALEEAKDSTEEPVMSKNRMVLDLHKQGKTNVAIAKELGLGVGEVKLIVELFQNA